MATRSRPQHQKVLVALDKDRVTILGPVDYKDELDRGTVDYDPKWQNYSYHKVKIPSGTVVKDCNFAQKFKNTNCITITRGTDVTFIGFNLVNVVVDSKWILQGCNNTQSDIPD